MMRLFSSGPSGSVPSTAPAGPSQAPVPTVVVLGMTGDGKSNLSTWLLGNPNVFRVSDSAESCTEEPLAAVGNCFGKYASYDGKWQVVDTPGLSDSAGRDAQNLRSTVALLKNKVKQATAFILVVNAQQDRMSAALKNTIRVFRGCFGPSLWANLCVVFTKWDWAKRHGGFTVDKLNQRRAEWNKWFLKCEVEYNGLPDAVSGAEIQFFAVDLPSLALVLQDGGDEEVEDMLLETSKSGLASTGEQIRMLYNHIYIVLAAKTPVNMLLAEAKTEQLHEEIAARLKEEKAERARQVEQHQKALKEEQQKREAEEAKRMAEQKEAKAREAQLRKEAEEKRAADLREAQEREARLRREAEAEREASRRREEEMRRREEEMRRAQEAAERRALEAQLMRQVCSPPSPSYSFSPPCYSDYGGSSMGGGGSSRSSRSSGGGSRSSGGLGWNEFQHSVGGQGYTRKEIQSMYHAQKKR
eukprot:CAMPEP_0174293704 /NCGR_PEP_ID=MMETSP0809-20121228/39454_1 /TAXON_ID=73025 ORGANISM="Eutreptiella gymnastica-like, Strain CCMP1594" /NCGR_SAMPLE_ID=MMETSP0809 /ASSEMBLY_ACC=CAM_ASM_000658 /LENGTH=470 /DNA_ID=CAMNT_0015394689 /DNA_START=22 /DNA_END=1434 /DNA_ORIENTATION=+